MSLTDDLESFSLCIITNLYL